MAGRVPLQVKAGYGIGQIAGQLFRDTPSLLLLFFLTNVMGISPAIAGTAIFVPKVVLGAIFDLSVGVASDRYAGRFPRRRWLLAGALAAPVAMLGVFAVPEASLGLQVTCVVVSFSAYMAVYSGFSVPYLAMFSEMTADPRERTELMGWKHSFGGIGLLLSSSLAPMAVSALGADRRAHLLTMGSAGLVCLACLLIAWHFAARIPRSAQAARPSAFRDLPRALADRPFAILCLSAVVMTISAGIGYASFPFFVKYVMGRSDPLHDLGVMSAIMAMAVLAGSPLSVMVAGRIGKVRTYVAAAVGHALVVLVWGHVPNAPIGVAYVLAALLATFNAAWGTIILSLLSDRIAQAEARYGESRAGSYSAIWSAIEKCGIALGGTLIVGLILSAYGFDSAAARQGHAQSAQAIAGIVAAYSTIPGIAKLLAATMIWKFVREPGREIPRQKEPVNA